MAAHKWGLPANEWVYIDEVLLVGFLTRDFLTHEREAKWGAFGRLLYQTILWQPGYACGNIRKQDVAFTHGQVVTIESNTKAYQKHLTLCRAALIRGQPFEETSFMVGKYIIEQPKYKVFPYH